MIQQHNYKDMYTAKTTINPMINENTNYERVNCSRRPTKQCH